MYSISILRLRASILLPIRKKIATFKPVGWINQAERKSLILLYETLKKLGDH